jgi:hypothetical protein
MAHSVCSRLIEGLIERLVSHPAKAAATLLDPVLHLGQFVRGVAFSAACAMRSSICLTSSSISVALTNRASA